MTLMTMWSDKLFFLVTCLFTLDLCSTSKPVTFCYWGTWSYAETTPSKFLMKDIDTSLCTHIAYAFVGLNFEGDLLIIDEWFDIYQNGLSQFKNLKKENPEVKLLVALGGWNQGTANYSEVAANPKKRADFIKQTVDFMNLFELDGLDFDWEYPNQNGSDNGGRPQDYENFVTWLQEYRNAFDAVGKGWLLTAAVGPLQYAIDISYNVTAINAVLDYINLMTFDFHGIWNNETGANAPLNPQPSDPYDGITVKAGVQAWIAAGATPSKMLLGIGSFGKAFTLKNPKKNGTGAKVVGGGSPGPWEGATVTWSYLELCVDQRNHPKAWTVINYEDSFVYAYKGSLWIGYDDYDTVFAKGKYASLMGLGGIMLWSLDNDDFKGDCGEKYPLLRAAIRGFRGEERGNKI